MIAILFSRNHSNQLSTASTNRIQLLCGLIGNRTKFWPDLLGKFGQNVRVDPCRSWPNDRWLEQSHGLGGD